MRYCPLGYQCTIAPLSRNSDGEQEKCGVAKPTRPSPEPQSHHSSSPLRRSSVIALPAARSTGEVDERGKPEAEEHGAQRILQRYARGEVLPVLAGELGGIHGDITTWPSPATV